MKPVRVDTIVRTLALVVFIGTGISFWGSEVRAENVSCVFSDLTPNEACPAFTSARTLKFFGLGDDSVIYIESDSDLAKSDSSSVVASLRVEESVLRKEMDEDTGLLLEAEVQDLSGARYEIPKSRLELKKQLGLPANADVAKEDWIELIRVHAETVLSISAVASRFLLDQLGLVASTVPFVGAIDNSSVPAAPAPVAADTPAAPTAAQSELRPIVIEAHRDSIAL